MDKLNPTELQQRNRRVATLLLGWIVLLALLSIIVIWVRNSW